MNFILSPSGKFCFFNYSYLFCKTVIHILTFCYPVYYLFLSGVATVYQQKQFYIIGFHSHFCIFGYENRIPARIISPLLGFWRRKNVIGEIIRLFLFYHLIFHHPLRIHRLTLLRYLNLTCKLSFIKSSPFSLYTSPKSCLDVDAVSYFVLLNKYSSK